MPAAPLLLVRRVLAALGRQQPAPRCRASACAATRDWKFDLKLFSFFLEVSGQPCVQQTLSLLLPLLGFFIQTLDPQVVSQVSSTLVLCGESC